MKTYAEIQKAFPGAQTPAQIVVTAPDVTAPRVRQGIAELERRALATKQMLRPIEEFVNPDRTVARIQVPLAGSGDNATSIAALETLRSEVLPQTLGRLGA